jgi:predicted acylesterase/phospholipase RssA
VSSETRIGLVLGAGGTQGGVFIRAALAAITERTGFVSAMSSTVIGTSVGALNAARIDPDPVELDGSVVERLRKLADDTAPPKRTLVDRTLAGPRQLLGRVVGRVVPAGTHTPDYPVAAGPYHHGVRIVSCRRSDGSRRIAVLSRAAYPAAELYASAAIPGFAPSVLLDGVEHVDGAVWSTTNADLVSSEDHDVLIVIAPMAARSGGGILPRSHRSAVLAEVAPWKRAGKPVILIAPSAAAIEQRNDHESFAAEARSQILL